MLKLIMSNICTKTHTDYKCGPKYKNMKIYTKCMFSIKKVKKNNILAGRIFYQGIIYLIIVIRLILSMVPSQFIEFTVYSLLLFLHLFLILSQESYNIHVPLSLPHRILTNIDIIHMSF